MKLSNGLLVVALVCSVRGCGLPLDAAEHGLRCAAGHAFDRARAGYVNLLQPRDRRSKTPGDTRETALARRRLYESGYADPLLAALLASEELGALGSSARVLDVGCGEGWFLASLAGQRGWEAYGVDLSRPSIELAARLSKRCDWVVANADRFLPYPDASFDLILSLTARLPAAELRRVLRPEGWLMVAVAGPDDLVELRQGLHGRVVEHQRLARARAELAPWFEQVRQQTVRWSVEFSPDRLSDLLTASYRGARHRERERLATLSAGAVTMSRELGWFGVRGASESPR